VLHAALTPALDALGSPVSNTSVGHPPDSGEGLKPGIGARHNIRADAEFAIDPFSRSTQRLLSGWSVPGVAHTAVEWTWVDDFVAQGRPHAARFRFFPPPSIESLETGDGLAQRSPQRYICAWEICTLSFGPEQSCPSLRSLALSRRFPTAAPRKAATATPPEPVRRRDQQDIHPPPGSPIPAGWPP